MTGEHIRLLLTCLSVICLFAPAREIIAQNTTNLPVALSHRHVVIQGKPEGMDGIEAVDIVPTNAASTDTNGVVLSIGTEKANYSMHEPVNLNVSLKKFGLSNVFALYYNGLISPSELYIILPDNIGRAKETEYNHRLELGHFGSAGGANLKGGDEAKESLEINRLFDMTLSGEYKIFVRRKVELFAPKCKIMIQTSAITFHLTEKALRSWA